jgi:hypothetical protein
LVSLISTQNDHWFLKLNPDWRVLAFSSGMAGLTCMLFGLIAAIRATRTAPGAGMGGAGRGLSASQEHVSLRGVLAICQIAFSLVLLVSALLFSLSLRNLMTADTGIRQEGILVTYLDMTGLKLPVERWDTFKQQLLGRIRMIPRVEAAADTKFVPLSGNAADDNVWLDGGQGENQSVLQLDQPGIVQDAEHWAGSGPRLRRA